MTSILEEDVCMKCNQNNGVNSKNYCIYCGHPLCKNTWYTDLYGVMNVTLIRQEIYKDFGNFFKGCKDKKYIYNFECTKVGIDYEKECVMFFVKDLKKPISLRFERVHKLTLGTSDTFINFGWLNLKLINEDIIKLSNNTYNPELFKVLNKII